MPSVAVLGASVDPARYSHQAVLAFAARGYAVWPVHPTAVSVAGWPCFASLSALPGRPDVVTVYVNPGIGLGLVAAIAAAGPRLVLLNPGADGEPVLSALRGHGLHVVEACSLVLLRRGDPLALVPPAQGMR